MADEVKMGEEPEYEEKLDEKPKSVLMSMIRQLKTGMDLSKVITNTAEPCLILLKSLSSERRRGMGIVYGGETKFAITLHLDTGFCYSIA